MWRQQIPELALCVRVVHIITEIDITCKTFRLWWMPMFHFCTNFFFTENIIKFWIDTRHLAHKSHESLIDSKSFCNPPGVVTILCLIDKISFYPLQMHGGSNAAMQRSIKLLFFNTEWKCKKTNTKIKEILKMFSLWAN